MGDSKDVHQGTNDLQRLLDEARLAIGTIRSGGGEGTDPDAEIAGFIARWLLRRALELRTPEERDDQAAIDRLIRHPADKATLVEMTDQAFRAHDPERVADQLSFVLQQRGIPHSFGPIDRAMLATFRALGPLLPGVTVPLVLAKMREEAEGKVLHAEPEALRAYLRRRHEEGVRINLNFLGEAVLSESESRSRFEHYLRALEFPEVECISAKISTLYSQVSPLAHRKVIEVLGDRLTRLIRAAQNTPYQRPDGRRVPKFIYLDMEEYRDMRLTVAALQHVLADPSLATAAVGVAIQAYIPDSAAVVDELLPWACQRRDQGGAPITLRLVKGANMEMERVESAIEGWPQAPFENKWETDANWKRLLKKLLAPQYQGAVRIGVASHNLFDLSLAIVWTHAHAAFDRVQFEMLEGMADHQRRALGELVPDLLLYAPACRESEFVSAIGYLIRRLDENTVDENFLRHAFVMQPDGAAWKQQEQAFRHALHASNAPPSPARRTQDRRRDEQSPRIPRLADRWTQYVNEPNTDWSLPHNIQWIESGLKAWQEKLNAGPIEIPLTVAGRVVTEPRESIERFDPSRPEVLVSRTKQASAVDLREAIACAKVDPTNWRATDFHDRHERLRLAAGILRQRRGDLIAAAVACGGKTILEADPEVSEAVDFTEFYPLAAQEIIHDRHLKVAPRGVVLVVSPWNFPIAIPCGGVAAALATGNCVLLKPASDTVLCARILCECFWDAGIPHEVLQLLPCSGEIAGKHLIADEAIDTVILTGGTATAENMLRTRKHLDLWAETGGKNAMIVTRLADRDLAIKHVLTSAFGHGGQKCSATSLLLLERPVYEDPNFRRALVEAAASLIVGSAWDGATRMGPLIRSPSGALLRGLTTLEPGESWALEPRPDPSNPNLWSPGIKWDVALDSFTHRTELFGPVLGVMPFDEMDEAIELVHATGYGLTSGLHSLDEREQAAWREKIRAGNLYINRPTTGAIVLRQPFGGMGKSVYGTAIKAGGPHYVVPLLRLTDASASDADQESLLEEARRDYREWADREFLRKSDTVRLLGQDNHRRYVRAEPIVVRVTKQDRELDFLRARLALQTLRISDAYFSIEPECATIVGRDWLKGDPSAEPIEWEVETADELASWISAGQIRRVRYLSERSVEEVVRIACVERFLPVVDRPVVSAGRIELLWYLEEQSISYDYHRYGNLGRRANDSRRRGPSA